VIREFRDARIGAGISQEDVGRAIDRSDAWISWTESGRNESLSIIDATRMLACVGLDLSVRAYPAGRGIRDQAQLDLMVRFKSVVAGQWRWRTEVPIPLPGDQRAWDIVLHAPDLSIGVEAETRLRDFQAIDRRVMLKLRDSQIDRAIILVASTRANRTTLRDVGASISANYPISSRRALEALAGRRDPGGNAIVVLPASSARTGP
jgi:transcriptional regulator with XRE-family HTH domain